MANKMSQISTLYTGLFKYLLITFLCIIKLFICLASYLRLYFIHGSIDKAITWPGYLSITVDNENSIK